MVKRYQKIIENDRKLLGQFPLYYDCEMIPLTTPVTRRVNAPSILKGDTVNNDRIYVRCQEKGASPSKITETGSISIDEYTCTSIVTEKINDDNLPKIMEVYSLNPMKLQDEVTAKKTTNDITVCQESMLKRRDKDGFSCKSEQIAKMNDISPKQDSKNVVVPRSQTEPQRTSDNFIDLTVDDEEETNSCSVHDGAISNDKICSEENVNVDNHSELGQLMEDQCDKGIESESKRLNQRKRKGGFGYKRKGKRRRPAQNQQRNTNKCPNAGWGKSVYNSDNVVEGCDSDPCKNVNGYVEDYLNDECEQSLNDQNNNNDWKKEETSTGENTNEREQNWSCSSGNDGFNSSLDMSYRENKITTLKARLAKQEEELAKLRTQKITEQAKDRNLEAQCTKPSADVEVELKQMELNDNLNIQCHVIQEEEADPGKLNLDDICQHVIKSFHIFNARQCKDKTRRKEECHGLKVYEKDNCFIKKTIGRNSDVGHRHQGAQDEFLFQVGLRRSFSNA